MKTKFGKIILSIVLILALIGILTLSMLSRRIPMNPSGTIGNRAGNLYNAGLFVEKDGMVYFANPKDGGTLYSMTVNEGEITKLGDASVRNLLAGGKYLYFFQLKPSANAGLGYIRASHGFYRYDMDSSKFAALTTDVVVNAQLVNNFLYILTTNEEGPLFYKMKIDKSEQTTLSTLAINPSCAEGDYIYYNGVDSNHYLYSLNTNTDVESEVWAGNIWFPVVMGDYVYYLDVANDYRLCRYIRSQGVVEVLTNDRVDCFNISGGYIYYQKNSTSSPALIMMNADGSNRKVVAEGNYTNINVTSQYVYFQEYGKEASLYHAPLGSTVASPF